MGHVVVDADGEPGAGRVGGQLVEDGLDHGRVELLRRQPVAASDDPRQRRDGRPADGVDERRGHIQQQRLAGGARLLGAVEHRDRPHRRRQRVDETVHRERPVEADLDQADLLAPCDEMVDDLVRALGARAHHHHDPLGLGMPDVVEQPIAAPGQRREAVHGVGHDAPGRRRGTGWRPRGPGRRCRGSARCRGSRGGPGDSARARCAATRVVVDERVEGGVVDGRDLLDLVRGAEPVEEVQERHP